MRSSKLTSLLITLIFITIFGAYFALNYEDFKILLAIKVIFIALIVLAQLLLLATNALFLIINLEVFDSPITAKEAIKTTILTSVGNFFTPFRGGAGLRAIYLKKNYNLAYSSFLSTLAVYYILIFLINSVLALIGLITLNYRGDRIDPALIFGFSILSIFLFYLILFPKQLEFIVMKLIPKNEKSLLGRLLILFRNTLDGWELVAKNKTILLKLFVVGTFNTLVAVILYYLELKSLGIEVNLLNATVFSAISSISLLFSITPGSFGIKESLLVLFRTSLALTSSQVLAVSLVDRGVNFFLLILLLLVIKTFINGKNNENSNQQVNA